MQLVGRADALALDRLRHPVRAVREHAIHPLRELVRCRCMVLSVGGPAVAYLTGGNR